jgi:hypothetical protein
MIIIARSTRWIGLLTVTVIFGLFTVPVQAETIPTNTLALWLKADAITAADNDPVSSWTDSSPLPYTVAAVSGQEPTYIASSASFAGKPVVRFDGVNDAFDVPSFAMPSPDMTVFVVGQFSGGNSFLMEQSANAWGNAGFIMVFGGSAGGTAGVMLRTDTPGMGRYADFGTQNISAPVCMALQYASSPDTWAAWTNGAALPAPPFVYFGGGESPTPVTGGATDTLKIMRYEYPDPDTFNQGDIAEMLIYKTALSTTERQLVEGLLAWKYGMQASLPDGHPWKETDPSAVANLPPSVAITSPANNSILSLGSSENMTASASDVDGSVTNVAFYTNGVFIGEDSSSPFSLAWTASAAGTYSLTAKAWDDQGASNVSESVSVRVASMPQAGKVPTNGLALWLKADAITGKSNGQALSAWDNSSPVTYLDYLVAAPSGKEPTYIDGSASFAGKPVVRFDGVNDVLNVSNFVMAVPDVTVFVVGEFSGGNSFIMEQSPNSWGNAGFYVLFGGSAGSTEGNVLRTGTGMGRWGNFGTYDISAPVFTAFQYDATPDTWSAWTNGAALPSITPACYGGDPPAPLAGGATDTLKIMRLEYNNTFRAGDVAEVLVYTAALNQSDRQLVEGLLAWKYRMQAKLPADHPWKATNPGGPTGTVIIIK